MNTALGSSSALGCVVDGSGIQSDQVQTPLSGTAPRQIVFGRFPWVRTSDHTFLRTKIDKLAPEQEGDKGVGLNFRVCKLNGCEPALAVRIPRSIDSKWVAKELERDSQLYANMVAHENIVSMFCMVSTEKYGLVEVMPLYDGDMADYVEANPYSAKEICQWLKSVCAGLSWMHKHGWVHGDIKVENILFQSPKHGLKLAITDMGQTKKVGQTLDTRPASSNCAPEISAFWWSQRNLLCETFAGVDYVKRDICMTSHDLWSIGFMIRFMVDYFDRTNEKETKTHIHRFMSAPVPNQTSEIEKIAGRLTQRTRREQSLSFADQTVAYCRVEDSPEGKEELRALLQLARKAMAINCVARLTIAECVTQLASINSSSVRPMPFAT